MIILKRLLSLVGLISCSGINIWINQVPAFSRDVDVSPLCQNRQMNTEILINTPEFFAAICSIGEVSSLSQCYIPTDLFYVGQSRKTAESIQINSTYQTQQDPYMGIYKSRNGIYTYQIATSGGYTDSPWTSLSVFENGNRIYYHKSNSYYGFYDC